MVNPNVDYFLFVHTDACWTGFGYVLFRRVDDGDTRNARLCQWALLLQYFDIQHFPTSNVFADFLSCRY